jgi:hypothetical protein
VVTCSGGHGGLLYEFVEESESGKILHSISGIGVINASAFLIAIDKG